MRGFTLLEVVVALTAGALLLVALHGLVSTVVDVGARLVAVRRQAEVARGGDRWLRALIASTVVGQTRGSPFEGRPHGAEFTAMVPSAFGWHEARRTRLLLESGSLMASIDGAAPIVLGAGARSVEFDYLLEPGADARWVRAWSPPVSAPLAIRVRLDLGGVVDTALYLVGPRG